MSLPSAPVKALGKEDILKKIQNPLCRVPYYWHLVKTPFAECHAPALGKVFFDFHFFELEAIFLVLAIGAENESAIRSRC